eukprot:gene2002-3895_t
MSEERTVSQTKDDDLDLKQDSGDEDSQEEDDEDMETYINGLFPNPLEIIDPNADLDAVLAAKSVGDALLILCPDMPGVPTKIRGKYQKRRLLNQQEKERMMRHQNRENARRTRTRRKIFSHFLSTALTALESVLQPKSIDLFLKNQSFNNESYINNTIMLQGVSGSDVMGIRTPNPYIECLRHIRAFLEMRFSFHPSSEDWISHCSADIVHTRPYPPYRKTSKLGVMRDMFECHGIEAIIDEANERKLFITKIIPDRLLLTEISLNPDKISYSKTDARLMNFSYEYILYDIGPISSSSSTSTTLTTTSTSSSTSTSTSTTDQNPRKVVMKMNIQCYVTFADDYRVRSVLEFYNTLEVFHKCSLIVHTTRSSAFLVVGWLARQRLDRLLSIVEKFVYMRYSTNPRDQPWSKVCDLDVAHFLPFPSYRRVSPMAMVRETLECYGYDSLVDDSEYMKKFITNMHSKDSTLSGNDNRLLFSYDIIILVAPKSSAPATDRL